ncbi:MAG: hypothetical protein KGJ59_01630 [Bacteroidota bacterium]|nr:hypothetical protein [Bacteroidota bacterium]
MLKLNLKIFSSLLTLALLYTSSQVFGQSLDSTALREGSWALQFGIASNFTFTTFQGSSFAAKYQLSEKNAIRGGIMFYGNTNDGTNSLSGTAADTGAGTASTSNSYGTANVAVVVQYLWYLNPSGPVHFYCGLGPAIAYNYYNNTTDNAYLYSTNSRSYWERVKYVSKTIQWGGGAAGIVGVEWFASHWLSLHAMYNETIQYQWRSTVSNQDRSIPDLPNYVPYHLDNTGTSKGWYFSSPLVSFGLNVYL